MKKVLVPIANGSEEFEAVGIIDTLCRADFDVIVASVNKIQITGSNNIKLSADVLIDDCSNDEFDLIVLPGGLTGARNLRNNDILTQLLKKQASQGKYYAAICASPFVVLQYHGLLDGKKATVHPVFARQMINKEAISQRVVVDENCITSQGPGTVLEFSIKLIEILLGKDKSQSISKPMLICDCSEK
ncbi:MAG: DJ-1/PfpI family protein [Candidatus Cloacimonetes bacterium]|nr:DJ-1/PfpI family protein [Candidatus Cloacimonadota bacterium]